MVDRTLKSNYYYYYNHPFPGCDAALRRRRVVDVITKSIEIRTKCLWGNGGDKIGDQKHIVSVVMKQCSDAAGISLQRM